MFSYYERTLAVVPRWSIAPRLNPQSVAEHSFYVTLYTDKLCILLNVTPEQRLEAITYAMRHDMVEAQTGDTPGPVKRQIMDYKKLAKFEKRFHDSLGLDYQFAGLDASQTKAIVKAADLIDELFWVSMETLMGNRLMEFQRAKVIKRLNSALGRLGLYDLTAELLEECSKMARGVDLPENNDDLNR